jgi:hypothetical protein
MVNITLDEPFPWTCTEHAATNFGQDYQWTLSSDQGLQEFLRDVFRQYRKGRIPPVLVT